MVPSSFLFLLDIWVWASRTVLIYSFPVVQGPPARGGESGEGGSRPRGRSKATSRSPSHRSGATFFCCSGPPPSLRIPLWGGRWVVAVTLMMILIFSTATTNTDNTDANNNGVRPRGCGPRVWSCSSRLPACGGVRLKHGSRAASVRLHACLRAVTDCRRKLRKWEPYGWKSSSSSNLSIRAFRAYSLIEII